MDTIQIKMSENKYRVDIFMLYILGKPMQKKSIIASNHSNLYHEKIRGWGGGALSSILAHNKAPWIDGNALSAVIGFINPNKSIRQLKHVVP